MKKIYILLFGLFLSCCLQAQNYVPLLLDSTHTWTWSLGFDGDTLVTDNWTAFTYNNDGLPMQRRGQNAWIYFTYTPDTTYWLSLTPNGLGSWDTFSRSSLAYYDGRIISQFTESFQNGAFVNSSLYTFFYANGNQDTLTLLQHWKNGAWVDFYKKTRTFDNIGNNTEEAQYYANASGVLKYSNGKSMEYDSEQRLIQQTNYHSSVNGINASTKVNWMYGNDHLLDTLRQQHLIVSDIYVHAYDYSNPDFVEDREYSWLNNQWYYRKKELTFTGPEIYSNRPDSILLYSRISDTLPLALTLRRYYQYEELGNDSIYFREVIYQYLTNSQIWFLSGLIEEWYHLDKPVSVQYITDKSGQITSYPNPCAPGQYLTLKTGANTLEAPEVLVFDAQGRLVSSSPLNASSVVRAPNRAGTYLMLIRDQGRLVGGVRQLVGE